MPTRVQGENKPQIYRCHFHVDVVIHLLSLGKM